ncbi:MAG TPA: SAM-dependent methyltransferase, partial [Rectinemataceae bacterium]
MLKLDGRSYLAARGFFSHLLEELPEKTRVDGELVSDWVMPGTERPYPAAESVRSSLVPDASIVSDAQDRSKPKERKEVYWTRNQWLEPFLLEFGSISEAAKALKAIQRNWACYPTRFARRSILIAKALPPLPLKPKAFPFRAPATPMGSFTLLDEHLLLGSAICSSPFPNGEFSFVEDREGPPSRAYRKLWEAFVLSGRWPRPGDVCLDAGASPGGWTWVLASLGASVLSIDRAPLEPRIAKMPNVEWQQHDA